jgi:hypothetical protein
MANTIKRIVNWFKKTFIKTEYKHYINLLDCKGRKVINTSAGIYYYFDGKRHRTDGPAVECSSGIKYWYLDDKQIDCKDNEEFLKIVKYKWML